MHKKRELLTWIFERMCLHYGITPAKHKERELFIAVLNHYPDDLLCAAYTYICRHSSPQHFPKPDDFIRFMEPEYQRRTQLERCHG